MSAQGAQIITVLIPDLAFDRRQAVVLNSTSSFRYTTSDGIITLNSKNPMDLNALRGLLYVPSVPESACSNDTLSMIPSNVTRIDDLPPTRWPPIAIAPWTTNECTQAFLSSMRADAVGGAFFFQPNSGNGTPSSDSRYWDLDDNGQWQNDNQYPIYGLANDPSVSILEQLALYSGNITSAPNGPQLAEEFNINDSVRLAAQVDINSSPSIPSLWVFLIIVLGILLLIVLTTSFVMHMIQRRQRRRLAQRVARGEVDLEALGIKRLNVPQRLIDKMPIYTYTSSDPAVISAAAAAKAVSAPEADTKTAVETTTPTTPETPHRAVPYSQPVCPICLDDFVHNETQIRELPCNHIFHPECIDVFLRDNSSLCPMCKTSTLPKGYCPVNVTNIMVRRERLVRRMRARANGEEGAVAAIDAEGGHGVVAYQMSRLRGRIQGQRAARAGLHSSARTGGQVMRLPPGSPEARVQTPPAAVVSGDGDGGGARSSPPQTEENAAPATVAEEEVPAEVEAQGAAARRAWLRERFVRAEQRQYEEEQQRGLGVVVTREEERRPAWRRAVGRVFPGFS